MDESQILLTESRHSGSGGPTLPREVMPGLHWVASCLAISPATANVKEGPLAGKALHNHQSAYVLVGSRATAIVDTGQPRDWYWIRDQVRQVLGDRPLDYVVPTHPEYVHYGNTPNFLADYPDCKVAGDIRNLHLFHPEYVDRLRSYTPGMALDLGDGRSLVFVEPIIRDLPNTSWSYDTQNRVLFAADAFAYSHVHNAGQCALTSREGPPATTDEVKLVINAALHWAQFTDTRRHFERVEQLFATYPIDAIGPTHGPFIQDPLPLIEVYKSGFAALHATAHPELLEVPEWANA
jgi:flavorubredoxin